MHLRLVPLLMLTGYFFLSPCTLFLARAADPLADEQALRAAGLGADGPALLAFVRQRTDPDAKRVAALVEQLRDKSPEARARAAADLVALGPVAVPPLRVAAKDPDDRELVGRARRCLEHIEGPNAPALASAAARLLAVRKPDGAADALLAYLPAADNEAVLEQVKEALVLLAQRDGKPEPALVKALADRVAVRRAVAAEVLSQAGGPEAEPALRLLLADRTPTVRLRVALALGQRQSDAAVPVLIGLLTDLPLDQARRAEEFLFDLAGEFAPTTTLENDAARKKSRDAWEAWWKKTEGGGLLDEFRQRTLTDADRDKAVALIRQLGDNDFNTREQATKALSAMNDKILPLVRPALANPDLEVRTRAERVILTLEAKKDKLAPLSGTAARLVALRKPAGAAEVVLAYLSVVEDDPGTDDIQGALAAVALRDGKAEPVLVEALGAKLPRRRAAAAAALLEAGASEHLAAARKLLQDPDPAVRLTVALAAAGARDKDAVPVLISLLAELPPQQGARAEEYLRQVANDRGPQGKLTDDAEERKKYRDLWAKWWRDNGSTAQLVATTRTYGAGTLGYTLVVLPDMGQVVELGRDGKPRWTITGLSNVFDAQALPGDKVLIAELGRNRVTERNLKGEVLWEKAVNTPINCQRLANGNTFIATPYALLEVDRAGKEVMNLPIPGNTYNYLGAHKARNGQIYCMTNRNQCVILDSTGKELKSFTAVVNTNVSIDVLPNGRVVVPLVYNNKVAEYDTEGKIVWEATVQRPLSVVRLSNGNTLASLEYPGKVVELDRGGKVVWEYANANQTRVFRAKRR